MFLRLFQKKNRFEFSICVHSISNLPLSAEAVYVQLSRGKKRYRSTVVVAEQRSAVWNEWISIPATLYASRKDAHSFSDKVFKIQVKSENKSGKKLRSRTVNYVGSLNLAHYASVESRSSRRQLQLTAKGVSTAGAQGQDSGKTGSGSGPAQGANLPPTLDLTIRCAWKKDGGAGAGSDPSAGSLSSFSVSQGDDDSSFNDTESEAMSVANASHAQDHKELSNRASSMSSVTTDMSLDYPPSFGHRMSSHTSSASAPSAPFSMGGSTRALGLQLRLPTGASGPAGVGHDDMASPAHANSPRVTDEVDMGVIPERVLPSLVREESDVTLVRSMMTPRAFDDEVEVANDQTAPRVANSADSDVGLEKPMDMPNTTDASGQSGAGHRQAASLASLDQLTHRRAFSSPGGPVLPVAVSSFSSVDSLALSSLDDTQELTVADVQPLFPQRHNPHHPPLSPVSSNEPQSARSAQPSLSGAGSDLHGHAVLSVASPTQQGRRRSTTDIEVRKALAAPDAPRLLRTAASDNATRRRSVPTISPLPLSALLPVDPAGGSVVASPSASPRRSTENSPRPSSRRGSFLLQIDLKSKPSQKNGSKRTHSTFRERQRRKGLAAKDESSGPSLELRITKPEHPFSSYRNGPDQHTAPAPKLGVPTPQSAPADAFGKTVASTPQVLGNKLRTKVSSGTFCLESAGDDTSPEVFADKRKNMPGLRIERPQKHIGGQYSRGSPASCEHQSAPPPKLPVNSPRSAPPKNNIQSPANEPSVGMKTSRTPLVSSGSFGYLSTDRQVRHVTESKARPPQGTGRRRRKVLETTPGTAPWRPGPSAEAVGVLTLFIMDCHRAQSAVQWAPQAQQQYVASAVAKHSASHVAPSPEDMVKAVRFWNGISVCACVGMRCLKQWRTLTDRAQGWVAHAIGEAVADGFDTGSRNLADVAYAVSDCLTWLHLLEAEAVDSNIALRTVDASDEKAGTTVHGNVVQTSSGTSVAAAARQLPLQRLHSELRGFLLRLYTAILQQITRQLQSLDFVAFITQDGMPSTAVKSVCSCIKAVHDALKDNHVFSSVRMQILAWMFGCVDIAAFNSLLQRTSMLTMMTGFRLQMGCSFLAQWAHDLGGSELSAIARAECARLRETATLLIMDGAALPSLAHISSEMCPHITHHQMLHVLSGFNSLPENQDNLRRPELVDELKVATTSCDHEPLYVDPFKPPKLSQSVSVGHFMLSGVPVPPALARVPSLAFLQLEKE